MVRATRAATGARERKRAKGVILAASKAVDSHNVSNVGGWQSQPDYWMDSELRPLLYPQIFEAVVGYLALLQQPEAYDIRISGWANVNRRGHSNAIHDHLDQDWALSGVLYLADGQDASCTLRFADPRPFDPALPPGPVKGGVHLNPGVNTTPAGTIVVSRRLTE